MASVSPYPIILAGLFQVLWPLSVFLVAWFLGHLLILFYTPLLEGRAKSKALALNTRAKRATVLFASLLYLVTWVGGWCSHSKSIRSEAERIYRDAFEQMKREAEAVYQQEGRPLEAAEFPLHPDGPVAWVTWCFPIAPGILIAESGYGVGPLWGQGGIKVVLYYGLDSREIGLISGWIS
jgi:hypothetical protein